MLQPSQGTLRITAYCSCEICCGDWSDGYFANGESVGGKAIAADKTTPFGVRIFVPGYGDAKVKDRGSAIQGNRLDLYFHSGHQQALEWGVQYTKVYLSIADYLKIHCAGVVNAK